jgi:hypothetical protein
MDAPIDAQAACIGAINSGSACSDKCICDNCASQAVKCFSDARCRGLVDCANRQGCATLPDPQQQIACAMMKCAGEFADASGTPLLNASAFGTCVGMANCGGKCAPEGGTEGGEGGGDSAKPDTSSTDSMTPDSQSTPDSSNTPDSNAMPDQSNAPDSPPGNPPDSPPGLSEGGD